jgi:parvulin-like peptidyl-prolyl isomerase
VDKGLFTWTALLHSLVLIALGCGDDEGPIAPRAHGGEGVGGQVIATVDGVGVTISDVERYVAATGATPQEALRRLTELELLAGEAARRGYHDRPEVELVRDRARVQRFLIDRIEGVVTPESISAAAISARYEANIDRYRVPERRSSTHLLVRVPEAADEPTYRRAEEIARAILAEASEGDAEAVIEAAARRDVPEPLRLRREELLAFPREGALEAPYAEALFVTNPQTLHPETVRTSYGVHVIFVRDVHPAVDVSLEEATPAIRRELVIEGRQTLLEERLRRARSERAVEVNEPAAVRVEGLEIDS